MLDEKFTKKIMETIQSVHPYKTNYSVSVD